MPNKINIEPTTNSNRKFTLELKVIPVVQVMLCAIAIFSIDHYLLSFSYIGPFHKQTATLLFILSIAIIVTAVVSFKRSQTTVNPSTPENTSKIVDRGIYSYSRNPMYLAMALSLLGLCVFVENYLTFSIMPLFVWYLTRFQIIPEERMLTQHFGEQYTEYCCRVRRWV